MRPTDHGIGLTTAIKDALKEANVNVDDIDMFNCHATSTPKGDASEAACIKELIKKNRALITANKGNVGHMVAGAAITESLFAMQTFRTGIVPAIKNLSADWSCKLGTETAASQVEPVYNGLNYACENISKPDINVIVKNSLCFGGINMSAVFKRYMPEDAKI